MGSRAEKVFSLVDKVSLFALLGVIFGGLSYFFGIYLVESTCCISFEYFFLEFFMSLGGLLLVLPFTLAFCLLLIYFGVELVKKYQPKREIDANFSNTLLKTVIVLSAFSIFLFLIFLLENPHKLQVATCPPGPPVIYDFWFSSWISCAFPDISFEYFYYYVNLGLFFALLLPILVSCQLVFDKILLHHYYKKYTTDFGQ